MQLGHAVLGKQAANNEPVKEVVEGLEASIVQKTQMEVAGGCINCSCTARPLVCTMRCGRVGPHTVVGCGLPGTVPTAQGKIPSMPKEKKT